jgi:hypothetical protein
VTDPFLYTSAPEARVFRRKKKVHDDDDGGGCGCWGCFSVVFALLLAWALLFGVTVGGRHYGMSCSMDRGVEVRWGEDLPEAPAPRQGSR